MAVGISNAENEINLIAIIGEGSFGQVFRAEWMGTRVAAKRLRKTYCGDRNFVDKFEKERQTLEQAKHPNIVTFYKLINLPDQTPIIVTELLECDLLQFVCESTTEPRVDLPNTVRIMLDVAQGLNYLHQKAIVHRDLASKNILLTHDRQAKIADLGVAKAFSSYSMMATAGPGTPLYSAPETYSVNPYRLETEYTVKVDVFSFGAVLLEVIVGPYGPIVSQRPLLPPFSKDGEVIPEYIRRSEFLYKIDHDHPLRKLVCSCLENEPRKRPKTEDIVEQLRLLRVRYSPAPSSVDANNQENRVAEDSRMCELHECDYDFKFKILLLGQPGVGKTSIINRLANPDELFQDHLRSESSRCDEHYQQIQVLGKWVHLQVVEDHNVRDSVPMIYRNVKGAVVVFDLTSMVTFSVVGKWVDVVRSQCDYGIPILLLGNKNDLNTSKEHSAHAQEFATNNGLFYLETSANTGNNVDNAFAFLVGQLMQPKQSVGNLKRQTASSITCRQSSTPVPSFSDSIKLSKEENPLTRGSAGASTTPQCTSAGQKRNVFQRCCNS